MNKYSVLTSARNSSLTIYMGETNLEHQLQVAFATTAELREQIDSLTRVNWSLEDRLRHDAEHQDELE